MAWPRFFDKLKEWEKRYDVKLIVTNDDFKITKTKKLPAPFRKDEKIRATVVCRGRMPGEMIAAAKERTITIPKCEKKEGATVLLKITRAKHNVFYAKFLGNVRNL
jgi:uncharacterized Fe-S cluster-containing radical SAM superfamily enzyme